MTPQTSVMYAAALRAGASEEAHDLLLGMNRVPGSYDAANSLVPLHAIDTLHFARILVVRDLAASDRALYGLTGSLPEYLVFLAEIDGEEGPFRDELVRVGEAGLRRLFSCCEKFAGDRRVADWLGEIQTTATASYVNWRGRTVRQVREEEALRRALKNHLCGDAAELQGQTAEASRLSLVSYVRQRQHEGLLPLTPEEPTPITWWILNLLNVIYVPLVLLILSPLLIVCLPLVLFQIRHWERTDQAIAPPLTRTHADALAEIENHEVTNQFNVFGSLKPGRLRWMVVRFLLWLTDWAARHLYHRGGLARVSTIHFARWVAMDGGRRMLFSSIYDGSLESYMDDFINKVGFGLNLTFSNGIGYPRTRWLLMDGCKDEETFKRVLRRHQLATEVWYNAHPGLTAANKHRNMMIREGLESLGMSEEQASEWLALI